jgi:hypothetical protein
MKFNREKLLAFTTEAIAERHADAERRTAEAAEKWEQERRAYIAETEQGWRDLVKQINLVLRSKRAMIADDIPQALKQTSNWSSRATVRVWDSKPPAPHTADVRDLERIKAVLEATEDAEVTDAGLARVGIKLSPIFAARAAAALRKA